MTVFLRSVSSCLDSAIATMDVHRFVDVRPSEANTYRICPKGGDPRSTFPSMLKIKPAAEIHGSQNAFFQQLQDCILNPCADKRARGFKFLAAFCLGKGLPVHCMNHVDHHHHRGFTE
jgi:hypothetical protein